MSLEAAFAAFLGAVDRRQPCPRCERTTRCRCLVDDDKRRKARDAALKVELDKLVSIVRTDAMRTVMDQLARAGCNRGPVSCPTWETLHELIEEATDCD